MFQQQQGLCRFLLTCLEGIQPLFGIFGGQFRHLTQCTGALKSLECLLILNGAGLLHVQRLLVIGELAFQLIHLQLCGFGTRFIFRLLLARFGDNLVLFFQTVGQLFQIAFIALDLFLLTHRRLHQVKVIAGGLIIRFQIGFCATLLRQFARHFHMAILLSSQLFAAAQQIAAQCQRAVQMNTPLIGMAHIVRRHVGGGF
ncbi:hypothetical protein D3C80_846620 [compost metagenome]